MSTSEKQILFESKDGIGWLIFNRPETRNAMTFSMYDRLEALCKRVVSDENVRVLILRGARRKRSSPVPTFLSSAALQARGRDRIRGKNGSRFRCPRRRTGSHHRSYSRCLHRWRRENRCCLRPKAGCALGLASAFRLRVRWVIRSPLETSLASRHCWASRERRK
jgi:hypothetical protein